MSRLEIVHSLARLQCTRCGAEANASCNCGEPYKPVEIAKAYSRKNPSASVREISAQTGVSHASAQRAKSGVSGDTPVTGRDGKTYKGKREPSPNRIAEKKWMSAYAAFEALEKAALLFEQAGREIVEGVFVEGYDDDRTRKHLAIVAQVAEQIGRIRKRT
jgi:hypothetical protein